MSNNLVTMQNVRSKLQLIIRGFSGRKISRDLVLSRNTVKLYTVRFNTCAFSLEQLQQMDDAGLHAIAYADAKQMQADSRTGDFKSRINYFMAELKRTGVTKQLLWEDYKLDNVDGYEYSQFCELFAQHKKVNEATMHFEHKPGDVMMVDFAGDNLSYVNKENGELHHKLVTQLRKNSLNPFPYFF